MNPVLRHTILATLLGAAAPAVAMASVAPRLAARHTAFAPVLSEARRARSPVLLARAARAPVLLEVREARSPMTFERSERPHLPETHVHPHAHPHPRLTAHVAAKLRR